MSTPDPWASVGTVAGTGSKDDPWAKVGTVSTSAKPVDTIDYDTGLPFVDRVNLAQADNPKEALKYLESVYGAKNVGVASDGTLYVTKDGKQIAVYGGSKLKGFAASVAGTSPTLAGMTMGGIAGAEIGAVGGPWGLGLGAIGGAIIGGVSGKALTEAGKAATGRYEKTPSELATTMIRTAQESAVGEMGGRAAGKAFTAITRGPFPRFLTQTTPESRQLTELALEEGGRPPAQSHSPGLKRVQFMEALARKAVSPVRSQDEANARVIENRMRALLKDSGIPDQEIATTIAELARGDSRVATADVGEHVKKAVIAHKDMLEANINSRLAETQTALDKSMSSLDILTRRFQTGDLGVDVATSIRASRRDFGTALSKIYEKMDSLVGDQPLVSSNLVNKEINRILRVLPPDAKSVIAKRLADVGLDISKDQNISFAAAQRIRTIFREHSIDTPLLQGVTEKEAGDIASAMDYSIQQAGKNPKAARAVALLNKADSLYGKGIQKFKDATVQRLLKDMEAGLPPNPETVASRIIQPGQEARVKTIRKLIGEDNWKQVVGADYTNMIRSSTDETGKVSGVRLLRQISERRGLMKEIYGPQITSRIEELAKTIAARDGSMPVESLAPGALRTSVENLKAAEKASDDFMRKNALSLLARPKGNPEKVYQTLVDPKNGKLLKDAVALIGDNSPQIQAVRQTALKQVFAHAKMFVAQGIPDNALTKALNEYTPEQQKILFPNGMAGDLKLLGQMITHLMKNLSDESMAGMSSGFILRRNFMVRIPLQAPILIYQMLASQRPVIRYLSIGLRSGGKAHKAAKDILESLIRYGAVSPEEQRETSGD